MAERMYMLAKECVTLSPQSTSQVPVELPRSKASKRLPCDQSSLQGQRIECAARQVSSLKVLLVHWKASRQSIPPSWMPTVVMALQETKRVLPCR